MKKGEVTNMIRSGLVNLLILTVLTSTVLNADENSKVTRWQHVLEMHPIGYWPADEGQGEILYDRSGNNNNGRIYHTSWENGLLNFTSGFQWAEVPSNDKYRIDKLTIGGWLFSRQESYQRSGLLFMGMANPIRLWSQSSIVLRIRKDGKVEFVSNPPREGIASKADKKGDIAVNKWQHLLYTYESGTGKLYLNGQLVQSRDNVQFKALTYPLIIGNCAEWWMLHPPISNSLDGSVLDLVLFDRALTPEAVTQLYQATRPVEQPRILAADAMVINGREIPLSSLSTLSVEGRQQALKQLGKRDTKAIRQMFEVLLPILTKSLDEWQNCGITVSLLMKIGDDKSRAALQNAIVSLTRKIQDEKSPSEDRAACVLALAEMKTQAKSSVPVLVGILESVLKQQGVRLPRVDDVFRNALMRALLDIDPKNERVREVIGLALAKPVFDSLDMSKPYLAGVLPLVKNGHYMDALDIYRALPPAKYGDIFFSQGDPDRNARQDKKTFEWAYTPAANYKGFAYKLGEGVLEKAVEPISEEDFKKAVQELAVKYPDAKKWRKAGAPHIYRVKITKTDAAGNAKSVYLEGENFILDGTDGKLRNWSIAIDKDGYIHIVGGQHNTPHPGSYIPGSWEKIGLSRDEQSDDFPKQLYWVSKKPGDITSLEFVGQQNNPRHIPSLVLNYMNFVQDNNGQLYLYGRINVFGWQSWGLYSYDTEKRRWTELGGDARGVISSAEKNNPGWSNYLIQSVRGGVTTTVGPKALVWAWQPNFYNYCRSRWGIRFDRTNRMHLKMAIRGLSANAHFIDSEVYAYSDDGGKTFHRANGSKVELPLTVNPAPSHNADIQSDFTEQWWELWISLLKNAGY